MAGRYRSHAARAGLKPALFCQSRESKTALEVGDSAASLRRRSLQARRMPSRSSTAALSVHLVVVDVAERHEILDRVLAFVLVMLFVV